MQKVPRRATGEFDVCFEAAGLFEVMRWVLAWGGHVTVLSPPELKQAVSDEVRMMAEKMGFSPCFIT